MSGPEIRLRRAKGRRSRSGWILVHEAEIAGGKGRIWQHYSGWVVKHCGHPTANRPWTARGPKGEPLIIDGEDGARCYGHLAAIQEMVELLLHNEACG
jgi:hypothetical protein